MIDQLWYTSATYGLNGRPGYQVRAATAGLSDLASSRFAAIKPLLGFALPAGLSPYQLEPGQGPVCLSFARGHSEQLLYQKVFSGDDDVGRRGNYFVHLLAGLPDQYTARDAIHLWRSSFWRISASELGERETVLPPVSPAQLQQYTFLDMSFPFVAEEHISYIIQAFLLLGETQQLFIAGEPDTVAALIWYLVQALPKFLLLRLTFSTYEQDVTHGSTLLVGTCWAQGRQASGHDLPPGCYLGKGLGLNCFTGRRSELSGDYLVAEYANFAARALVSGYHSPLAAILRTADEMGVGAVAEFLPLYSLIAPTAKPRTLTTADLDSILSKPPLAAHFMQQEQTLTTIVNHVAANRAWWKARGRPAIQRLQQVALERGDNLLSQALRFLARKASLRAQEALQERQDIAEAELFIIDLAAAALPPRDAGAWEQLFSDMSVRANRQPQKFFPWKVCVWVLKKGSFYAPELLQAAQTQGWLNVSLADLVELDALQLPTTWKKAASTQAFSEAITARQPVTVIYKLAFKYKDAFAAAIRELLASDPNVDLVKEMFDEWCQHACGRRLELIWLLIEERRHDVEFRRWLLQRAELTVQDVRSCVTYYNKYHGHENAAAFVAELDAEPALRPVLHEWLDAFELHYCQQPEVRILLNDILSPTDASISPELSAVARPWKIVGDTFGGMPNVGSKSVLEFFQLISKLAPRQQADLALEFGKFHAAIRWEYHSLCDVLAIAGEVQLMEPFLTGLIQGARRLYLDDGQIYWLRPYLQALLTRKIASSLSDQGRALRRVVVGDPLNAILVEAIDKERHKWPPELQEAWWHYIQQRELKHIMDVGEESRGGTPISKVDDPSTSSTSSPETSAGKFNTLKQWLGRCLHRGSA